MRRGGREERRGGGRKVNEDLIRIMGDRGFGRERRNIGSTGGGGGEREETEKRRGYERDHGEEICALFQLSVEVREGS